MIVLGLQFFSLNLPSHLEDVNYPEFISTKFLAWFASIYLTGSANYVEVILSGNHTKHLRDTTFASYVGSTPLHNHSIMDNSTVESPVLPKAALKNLLNPFYFPLMAHNLTGVLPAYIITCEYDILKSDGELYASRLRKAAVPVIHKHYYGFHASHLFHNSSKLPLTYKSAIRMTEDLMNFVRENL